MKEVRKYTCEYCGTEWDNATSCEECESQHIGGDTLINPIYTYNCMARTKQNRFPNEIIFDTIEGGKIVYKRSFIYKADGTREYD